MIQLPIRFDEGDIFAVSYDGDRYYYYTIEGIDDNIVTLTAELDDRGTFDVDEYEIADMFNGAESFHVRR